jgi:RimJ/RimL family protein N-acetyltransferase
MAWQLAGTLTDCGDNLAPIFTIRLVHQTFFMSSTSNFEVRPAHVRDAKAIAAIHASASQAAFKALFPGEQAPSVSIDKDQAYWRDAIEFNEPQVYVAVDEGQPVGFVGFDRSRDKGTPNTTGEIWAIYVAPSHWGQGVGLALWDAAREGLVEEGCTKVTLWVPLGNERALRFHDLAGFKREMTTIKTVPMGTVKVEEIRMKRDLS